METKLGVGERSGPADDSEIIIAYVCPKCGNYYGASSMGMLGDKEILAPSTASDAGERRGWRSDCPNCKIPRIKRYARLIPVADINEMESKIRSQIEDRIRAIPGYNRSLNNPLTNTPGGFRNG